MSREQNHLFFKWSVGCCEDRDINVKDARFGEYSTICVPLLYVVCYIGAEGLSVECNFGVEFTFCVECNFHNVM